LSKGFLPVFLDFVFGLSLSLVFFFAHRLGELLRLEPLSVARLELGGQKSGADPKQRCFGW